MLSPPKAKKQPVLSPSKKQDPYHWLRADNWQEVMKDPSVLDSEIREYLYAENLYADSVLADTKQLQEDIFEEMKGRIKEDDQSLPSPDGQYEYFTRFEIGAQYQISSRRLKGAEDTPENEEMLFDFDAMGKGFDYFGIGGICRSHSHRYMAYGLDTKGSEYYVMRFKDSETGNDLDDVLENTSGGVIWALGDEYVFYVTLNEHHRSDKVWRHKMGTAQSDDVVVYKEGDEGFFLGVSLTESDAYIVIDSHDHITTECYILKADNPLGDFELIRSREIGIEYDISHRGDFFYITTNADGAVDYKVVKTPVTNPGKEYWQDFVAYKKGLLISGISVSSDYMLRVEKENALPRIVIHHFDSGVEKLIDFKEEAYSLSLSGALEFDDDIMRFSYSSPTTQSEIYDYDMATGERILRKRQIIPSGHSPEEYVSRRIFAETNDGASVPITIVYKKNIVLDGNTPSVLYGYGSYGMSIPASFSSSNLSLLDRGFVYAVAHIRGGMDCGYKWYTDGKVFNKKNTFEDFIACGEALIENGFTGLGNITAIGRSAGGMLVGAIVNMRPDMFKSVVASVPFVDVLNTICDATLPLTPPEWNEWGNPLESSEVYDYIESYSPYDNIKTSAYPNMFVQGGLTDPRVTYWEPAKWVARLREHKTNDDTMLLLRTQMGAGHGGASGRFDRLKESAEEYAFILKAHNKN